MNKQKAFIRLSIHEDRKSRSYELTILFLFKLATTLVMTDGLHIFLSASIGSFGVVVGLTSSDDRPILPLIKPQG